MSVRARREISLPNVLDKPRPPAEEPAMRVSEVYSTLSPAEQAVAELGIKPGQLQPIKHLNESHYKTLCRKGMLDSDLQRRIEAHKFVSAQTK